jgi:hypothetical protein
MSSPRGLSDDIVTAIVLGSPVCGAYAWMST